MKEEHLNLIFIRHGKTLGNLQKRYIGSTDEALCEEGIAKLLAACRISRYPAADAVISSPMKRCVLTAEILYPKQQPVICEGLRECDFGRYEGKHYLELAEDKEYQQWLKSNGTLPFPDGEMQQVFKERCCKAFETVITDYPDNSTLAFVVHGGTIMAILERYAVPKKGFYEYQVENGGGFAAQLNRSSDFYSICPLTAI